MGLIWPAKETKRDAAYKATSMHPLFPSPVIACDDVRFSRWERNIPTSTGHSVLEGKKKKEKGVCSGIWLIPPIMCRLKNSFTLQSSPLHRETSGKSYMSQPCATISQKQTNENRFVLLAASLHERKWWVLSLKGDCCVGHEMELPLAQGLFHT